jgi:hypothetical protein
MYYTADRGDDVPPVCARTGSAVATGPAGLVAAGHLAFFVSDLVEQLDRSAILLTERSVDHDRHAAARVMTDIPIYSDGLLKRLQKLHQITLLRVRETQREDGIVVVYDREQVRGTAVVKVRWMLPERAEWSRSV